MSHTKIKEIRTRGGFSQNDEEPHISFVFDYEVENEDSDENRAMTFARAIVVNRHQDPSRGGWHARVWQFFTEGDYDSKVHLLGVQRIGVMLAESASPESDAQRLLSEAEALGDEYVKVLGQVPALFEQAKAWAEKNGLTVEVDIHQAEFDALPLKDRTMRGTVGFDIHTDPLRFDFDEEATAKLKAKFEATRVWRKAQEEERTKRHAADAPYEQKKRSDAAVMAAATRKRNQDWKKLQAQLATKVKSPSEVTK